MKTYFLTASATGSGQNILLHRPAFLWACDKHPWYPGQGIAVAFSGHSRPSGSWDQPAPGPEGQYKTAQELKVWGLSPIWAKISTLPYTQAG